MRNLEGRSEIKISGNFRIGDIRHNFADLSKAKKLLGFSPQTGFDQGVARFCAWVRDIGAVASDYNRSLEEMNTKGLLK